MVITCPHALGLAIPLVVAVSTSLAAKSGLLIRERQTFERARNLQAVVFDKTGTLTEGRFGVTDIISLSDEEEVLRLAASLEANSGHSIAHGVQNLLWATGYNAFAIPLAAGVLYSWGILLSPAVGAILMSLSTVIVAVNARFLKM